MEPIWCEVNGAYCTCSYAERCDRYDRDREEPEEPEQTKEPEE